VPIPRTRPPYHGKFLDRVRGRALRKGERCKERETMDSKATLGNLVFGTENGHQHPRRKGGETVEPHGVGD